MFEQLDRSIDAYIDFLTAIKQHTDKWYIEHLIELFTDWKQDIHENINIIIREMTKLRNEFGVDLFIKYIKIIETDDASFENWYFSLESLLHEKFDHVLSLFTIRDKNTVKFIKSMRESEIIKHAYKFIEVFVVHSNSEKIESALSITEYIECVLDRENEHYKYEKEQFREVIKNDWFQCFVYQEEIEMLFVMI